MTKKDKIKIENLILIIPAKKEPNSLPLVIHGLQSYSCKKTSGD